MCEGVENLLPSTVPICMEGVARALPSHRVHRSLCQNSFDLGPEKYGEIQNVSEFLVLAQQSHVEAW